MMDTLTSIGSWRTIMASTDIRRQKNLARHKAKRSEKRKKLASVSHAGLAQQMAKLSDAPIRDCRVTAGTFGIGSILISRENGGSVAFAVFLIDMSCLGVKDSWGGVVSTAEYRKVRDKYLEGPPSREIEPASARRLVDDAVEFAASAGFSPQGDYRRLRPILRSLNPELATEEFEMGDDGQPSFINGPHDAPDFCRRVIATLEANCGPGNYKCPRILDGVDAIPFLDDEDD